MSPKNLLDYLTLPPRPATNSAIAALAILLIACSTTETPATQPPEPVTPISVPTESPLRVTTERAFPGIPETALGDNILFLTYPPGDPDQIVVIEKEGRISTFRNSRSTNTVETLLDITSQVSSVGNEEGLLGLAFHPKFGNNQHFYVYYSAANPRRTVLSRFTANKDLTHTDPDSELVILEVPQPYPNHNGGMIDFGPDGFLYIALGDGGSRGDPHRHAQNASTLLGSIIRIDVDNPTIGRNYGIPETNPFASSTNGPNDPRPEIYAYGLRNPWRFSFDSVTGELWAGDVGQNRYEEINLIESGGNYGWSILEGNHCFNPATNCDSSGTILPVAEHDHSGRCSITGGYVYRGEAISRLRGVYLYSDFCSGEIFGIHVNEPDQEPQLLAAGHNRVASFGEDAQGNLYLLELGSPIKRIILD